MNNPLLHTKGNMLQQCLAFVVALSLFLPIGILYAGTLILTALALYKNKDWGRCAELRAVWIVVGMFIVWIALTIFWTRAPLNLYLKHLFHFGFIAFLPLWMSYKQPEFWKRCWKYLKYIFIFDLLLIALAKENLIPLPEVIHSTINANRSIGLMFSFAGIIVLMYCEYLTQCDNDNRLMRLVKLVGIAGLTLLYLWYGSSRSATIGLLLGLLFCFCFWSIKHKKYIVLGSFALLLICGALYVFNNSDLYLYHRFSTGIVELQNFKQGVQDASSWGIRMQLYAGTITLALNEPWFGYGLGSWNVVYPSSFADIPSGKMSTPHQDWLLVWMETGLIGLFLFASYWYQLWKAPLSDKQKQGFRSILTVFISCTLFNAGIRDASLAIPLLLLCAVAWHVFQGVGMSDRKA